MRALLAEMDAVSCQPMKVMELAAGDGALSAILAARGCSVTANDLRTVTFSSSRPTNCAIWGRELAIRPKESTCGDRHSSQATPSFQPSPGRVLIR